MSNEELKQEFLDIFLSTPTKEQVTPSQMKAMEELAEVFSNFPPEQSSAMLLMAKTLVNDPKGAAKMMIAGGATMDDLTDAQAVTRLLDSSRKAEQNRAN